MAEWLLEIFSEEIPSRMQRGAQEQLKMLATQQLSEGGLSFKNLQTFVTPRRLTLFVEGLPLETIAKMIEKKGPRIDASPAAIEGFLKTVGVTREDCEERKTPKGSFLFISAKEPSRPTAEILSALTPLLLEKFRWQKSMRWGNVPTSWVRPIRSFLSIFEGKVVPFSYAGVTASMTTQGHRFLSPKPFKVKNFQEYKNKLKEHYVILDWQERRDIILAGITQRAKEAHFTLLDDEDLLDEVAGLVEWPVVLIGKVDKHFMDLPLKVITTPMRVHQRYFPLMDNGKKKLAPYFGLISNIETRDKEETIITGNERVLRARLADAQFFWEQDQKKPLEHFNAALKNRLFHQHLGSLFDKEERLIKLSTHIAKKVGADLKIITRAALLCKTDLASHMVGEFPELQGIIGAYYAENQGEPFEVARAIEEHYWPKISGGAIPDAIPSLILGIADRLDTLIGFFTIGIIPSGSKDPFALRRAGLSLIALSLNPHFHLPMLDVLENAYDVYPWAEMTAPLIKTKKEVIEELWQFLLERLKFVLRDIQGSPYDHVDAVLSIAHGNSTFADLASRAQALDQLMKGEDGINLLAAYKRASNILKIEEEKDQRLYKGNVVEALLTAPEEKILFKNLQIKYSEIQNLVNKRDFINGVLNLARIRPFVDQFFDKVVVNSTDEKIRTNRLHLLAVLRQTLHQVADFSKLEGG